MCALHIVFIYQKHEKRGRIPPSPKSLPSSLSPVPFLAPSGVHAALNHSVRSFVTLSSLPTLHPSLNRSLPTYPLSHSLAPCLFVSHSLFPSLPVRPELFPSLIRQLQSSNPLDTQRAFLTLSHVLKELATKRLGVDQRAFAQVRVAV